MKFCLVSANRSGSTWLQFMLNLLPGVSSDYEINWSNEATSAHHRSLKRQTLGEILAPLSRCGINVVGSKLVLAPQHNIKSADWVAIKEALGEADIVIRIRRPFFESFYSKYLGGGHLKNLANQDVPDATGTWLNDQAYFDKRSRIVPHALDIELLKGDFEKRLIIEEVIARATGELNCFVVDYADIEHKFTELAQLLIPGVDVETVRSILEKPPTLKLPKPKASELFTNWQEVAELVDYYESSRLSITDKLATKKMSNDNGV